MVSVTDDWFGASHRMHDLYQAPKTKIVPGTMNRLCTRYKSTNLYLVQSTSNISGTNQTIKKPHSPTIPTAPSIPSHNSCSPESPHPLHEPSTDTRHSPKGLAPPRMAAERGSFYGSEKKDMY
jgi:hypothetical protein